MLGAVLQDAHQTLRQARKQFRRVHRIDDRRRLRIEEDDEIDIGGKVELVRAELAHAEHDPARPPARIVRVGQLQLALPVGVAQQEVDGGAHAGIGQVAQPAHGRFRLRLAGKIGQRNQEMRLELQPAQSPHQAAFAHVLAARGVSISARMSARRLSTV